MSTKHEGFTPGPWKSHVTPTGRVWVTGQDTYAVASVCTSQPGAFANARLIADAPRLYAENQRLRHVMERVSYALRQDGRTANRTSKAEAARWLCAALTEPDA